MQTLLGLLSNSEAAVDKAHSVRRTKKNRANNQLPVIYCV